MSSPVRDLWCRRDRSRRNAAAGVAVLSVIGLLSAVSRPMRGRLEGLLQVMPFLVPRTAAVTLVFVSFALLLTARGLRRGHHVAWLAAVGLLGISVVLHVVKGIDVEEASLATAGAAWLAAHRRSFPVGVSRACAVRALVLGAGGAVVTLVVAITLSATLGRGERSAASESARSAAARLGKDVPSGVGSGLATARSAHAGGWFDPSAIFPLHFGGHVGTAVLVALGLCLVGGTLSILFSAHVLEPLTGTAHRGERERARALVLRHGGGSLDYFALRDNKQWFFIGDSVVAYAVRAGVCLVSPDPIGPVGERAQTWAAFMTYAEESGWSVTVLGAAPDWLPVYERSGLRAVYLGDEAVVDCAGFTLAGGTMKGLRQAYHRVQRAGYTVTFHDPAALDPGLRRQLAELSVHSRCGEAERGFSMTLSRLFDEHDTGLLLSVARDSAGHPQAFVQWVPARDLDGWSLDIMHRNTDQDLPNGIMDFLVIETIARVAAGTGGGLDLNFAVMRAVMSGEQTGWLARLGRTAPGGASRRAQIESLWRFNAKYRPRWVPRYVVLGSIDTVARQGLVMVGAEGIAEIPVLSRLLGRNAP